MRVAIEAASLQFVTDRRIERTVRLLGDGERKLHRLEQEIADRNGKTRRF